MQKADIGNLLHIAIVNYIISVYLVLNLKISNSNVLVYIE